MNLHRLFILILFVIPFQTIAQDKGFTFEVDDVTQSEHRLNETTFEIFAENRFSYQVYTFPEEIKDTKDTKDLKDLKDTNAMDDIAIDVQGIKSPVLKKMINKMRKG